MTYILHHTTGRREMITTRLPLTLEQLQELVGGSIEIVSDESYTLVINEEGRLRGLPRNTNYPQLVGKVVQGVCNEDGDFIGAGRVADAEREA